MPGNRTIRTRVFFGFGFVLLVIAAIGAVGVQRSWQIEKMTVRVTELRTPTIRASTAMINGINQALAALRGWMLLGDSTSKASRASAWQTIRLAEREMRALSGGWTDLDNVSRLAEIHSELVEFERFQNEIEEIAQKGENLPATKLLFDEAIPLAKALSDRITKIIEIEKTQAPSNQRRDLLAAMADVRGTIGFTLADIRAYLLSATPQFRKNYERMWAENEARFGDLVSMSHLLTAEQRVHFEAFAKVRSEFAQLPPRMFALRAAPDHDVARFWLGARAAPIGARLTAVLDKMVASQYELLEADNRRIDDLIIQMDILLFGSSFAGLLVSGFVGYRLSRGISDPLDQAVVLAERIAEGRFEELSDAPRVGGTVETEKLIVALSRMAARLGKMVTDLRRSEATTQAIVDKSLTGILLTDRDGAVLQANPAAAKMFDYAASEILEQNHSGLVGPPVSDGIKRRAGEVGKGGDTKPINATYETVGHRRDGSVFPMVLARSHVNLADHQRIVMMITDISAAKQAENEITAAKEKAEEASQAKSFFLASMSHELRTPMNAVLGFAQLLDQDQTESLSVRHSAFVDEILRSGHYMMELIGDVLDLQAIESGSLGQEIEEQELRSLLDAAIAMVVSAADERGITVAILPPSEDRPVVRVDALRFKKIVLNLLSNAIKYNRPDGRVAVDWAHELDGQLRIRIADTGPGIPEGLRDRVFQPFDRLGVETSAVMGTGIGLTIAKRLIEAMDGRIGFDSTVGEGCTFWLEVPVVPT